MIPGSFLSSNTYDETKINHDPSKSLLDVNPHNTSRKWRLVKKYERELVCFDESRFLSDNFDEETLQVVEAIKNEETALASYLAALSMTIGMEDLNIGGSLN